MKKVLIRILVGLVVIFILAGFLSGFLIDYQWFNEVGYINVFFTSLKAKAIIFVPAFFILFLLIFIYVRYLRRKYISLNNQIYDKKEISLQNKIIFLASAILSFVVSLMFTGVFWYRILEFYNATDFGIKDPIFGYDASFYVFKLPLINAILGVLVTVVIILIGVTLLFYSLLSMKDGVSGFRDYMRGGDSPHVRLALTQLSIFGAFLLLLFAGLFYIRGLNLVYSPRGVAFGASYTDMHVSLPMFRIISVMCIVAAFVVAFAIIRKRIRWVAYTAGFIIVLMIAEVLISGVVEKLVVSPNARNKEMPYLTYNIDLTRKAFGLDAIAEKDFPVDNILTQGDINDNTGTIDNIRINEFSQSLEVYNQIQAIRNYYRFNDVDIDRYVVDGKLRQVFIAPRELDNSSREEKFQTWQNLHLFYTHGYGAVMSYTNTVSSSGLPEFIIRDVPVTGTNFKLDKPQLYFGELDYQYAVVGGKTKEIDYPTESGEANTTYTGTSGIKMNLLNRFLFTVNYGSLNFLLSNDITQESRIILNRNILDRVNKIAPFIEYDRDPYIVVSNGRQYWIIDGYTSTGRFPYSEPYNGINYVRNSVKVVIDAYDGKVDYYISDTRDALVQTVGKIYGGLFKDINTMPEDLRNHLRYSEDVFLLQSRVYEKYHMKNPAVFYNSEDLWSIAKYKGADNSDINVEAVHQVMRLPGEDREELLLTIPYTVANKENMVSWLAVKMDADNLSQMTLVKFPKDRSIYGPQQFNSRINTDTEISRQLSLWDQKGSQVILGETNIIPIKHALLYVRPLYLRGAGERSLPELKKVIVGLGEKIVMEDNMQQAFASLFNAKVTVPGTTTPTPSPTDNVPGTGSDVKSMILRASELYDKAKQAQQAGDWAAYGQYINELENVLNQLKQNAQ